MSGLRTSEELVGESATVLVISDSDASDDELTGFSSPLKRFAGDRETSSFIKSPSAKKKLKVDGEPNEDGPIDIDSISTNPMRTRTKVSSDTSSKFPVSSPSETVPLAGQRKKYVKNTLPAGTEWRMLQDIAFGHPPMTYREKLAHWVCCDELSDVEDVNNFDEKFQKREKFYSRSLTGRRSAGKDCPFPNYNYQHFRYVVLEKLRGSPVGCSQEPINKSPHQQPSCSKSVAKSLESMSPKKPDVNNVTIYEKILCPSSESGTTKASPSIRLHWTDDESVFRFNRLNPEIDKYSQLIKVRIDYNKQINFKAKINEIFKTPTVPAKYSSPPIEIVGIAGTAGKKSLDAISNASKSMNEQLSSEVFERRLEVRNSPRSKGSDNRNNSERKTSKRRSTDRRSSGRKSSDRASTERKSSEKFPEVNCFQQDEFCNYLGLGMNGKVYSPTPTDNKRRSLRVKRLLVQAEAVDKKNDKKKEVKKKKSSLLEQDDGKNENEKEKQEHEEVTTTNVNENRCSLPSTLTSKDIANKLSEEPATANCAITIPVPNIVCKTPEIKIITQLRNTATPTKSATTPSSITTANSTPPPTTRRQRRTRATSNGTSTCPRSSQSDESPDKLEPRGHRLNNHSHPNDHESDLSESVQSDAAAAIPPPSPQHNGCTSTVVSFEDKKDEFKDYEQNAELMHSDEPESMHMKFQRYLEESRKSKPSIFIVDSINNNEFKASTNCTINNNTVLSKAHLSKESKIRKSKKWSANNRSVVRRFLRRNGTVVGTFNQRILRNRSLTRSKIMLHQSAKVMKKEVIKMHLRKGKSAKHSSGEETGREPGSKNNKNKKVHKEIHAEVTKHNRASQVNIDIKKEVQSTSSQVDPLMLPPIEERKKSIEKCDAEIQTETYAPPLPISFLRAPSSRMPNPLTPENGRVIYAYYELDILIIIQDFMVTFWKTCKLIQVIENTVEEWVHLGECKRLLFDTEINAPFKNRICVHNSIPIYMEMRAKELPRLNRDSMLISIYVNVYYYHDEELVAKSHSIQLDTVASFPQNVVYTTITDSRYFVMCWSQETIIGKTLSGLCKYSLTPHLDTLASIREFKSMRHEIRYLECTTDDNLIGFGDTQVTLWDHRSGDILMNYDLDMQIGSNLGSLHFPPLEVGHAKTVLIFQKTSALEVSIIAINVSHNAPSHQFVCKHILPAEFDNLTFTMGIDDYTILTNTECQEIWIDHSDPQSMVHIKTPEGQKRFYSRCKQNVIVITENHLALETFSSFVLKMSNFTGI